MELLGELGIKPPSDGDMKFEVLALRARLRNRTAYMFFADPRVLLRMAYVARREKGEESYYQRILKKDRIMRITRFLEDDEQQSFFANNIILSFTKKPKFTARKGTKTPHGLQFGKLKLPQEYRSAWIVDGQHRLYGFAKARKARKRLRVPVLAFHNLPQEKQAELFLEINREQKPVSSNLLWDLEGKIHPESRIGVISNIVKKLNTIDPFQNRIYIPLEGPRKKTKHLNISNLCAGIDSRQLTEPSTESMKKKSKNPLFKKSPSRRVTSVSKALSEYFLLISDVFEEDWKREKQGFFFNNNGINVMLRVYEHMITYYGHVPTKRELRTLLAPLKEFYYEKYPTQEVVDDLRKSCSSEAVRGRTSNKFMLAIGRKYPKFAAELVVEDEEAKNLFRFEASIREFISECLELEIEENWESKVPRRVRSIVERKIKPSDEGPKWKFLTLGECFEIIKTHENWSDCFQGKFDPIFGTKTRFQSRFDDLIEYRNNLAHHRDIREADRELINIFLTQMRECLK
jgi:DNA sulfur modification protein DndB